jgi:hypothetical protein
MLVNQCFGSEQLVGVVAVGLTALAGIESTLQVVYFNREGILIVVFHAFTSKES